MQGCAGIGSRIGIRAAIVLSVVATSLVATVVATPVATPVATAGSTRGLARDASASRLLVDPAGEADTLQLASAADGEDGDPVDDVVPPRQVGTPLQVTVSWRVTPPRELVVEVSGDGGDTWEPVWSRAFAGGAAAEGEAAVPVEATSGGRYRYRARLTATHPGGGAVEEQVAGPVTFTLIERPVTYASRVVLRAPSASAVRVGGKQVTLSGRVTDRAGRPGLTRRRWVTLRFAGGPRAAIGRTRTGRDGTFTMTVPTSWHYAGRVAASVARGTHEHLGGEFEAAVFHVAAARSRARPRLAVRAPYRPQGSRRWSRLASLRWNPCGGPVTYRVNFARSPRGARRQVRRAFRMVSRATGLRFRHVGTTRRVPLRTRTVWPRYDPRADLTVAWANGSMFDTFRGGVLGVGGSSGNVQEGYTQGLVQLNSAWNRRLRRGFGRGPTLGSLLLHEIGHAVGLGHASDHRLVMNPSLGPVSWARYGRGDLIGLRRLGRRQGCWRAPDSPAGARPATGPLWIP